MKTEKCNNNQKVVEWNEEKPWIQQQQQEEEQVSLKACWFWLESPLHCLHKSSVCVSPPHGYSKGSGTFVVYKFEQIYNEFLMEPKR